MQSFRFLPSFVIPGLMLLSSVAFIIFADQGFSVEMIVKFLNERNNLLPYLSLMAVAVAFVIAASANLLAMKISGMSNDQVFDEEGTILQHGSVELIRSLESTYSGLLLYRLLYGALPFFCASTLIWWRKWSFIPSAIALGSLVSLLLLFLHNRNSNALETPNVQGRSRRYRYVSLATIVQLFSWGWLVLWYDRDIVSSFLALSIVFLLIFSPPILLWLHNLSKENLIKKREASLKICRDKAKSQHMK